MATSIIQFWHDPCIPTWAEELSRGWRRLNPQYGYKCFDFRSVHHFLLDEFGENVALAFSDINIPALAADVFRVAYLLARGGVWVHIASACLAPMHEWIPSGKELVMLRKPWMKDTLYACNGFIFSPTPRNWFLQLVWDKMVANLLTRSGDDVCTSYGAGLYFECFQELQKDSPLLLVQNHAFVDTSALRGSFKFGSSSAHIPREEHWERKQKTTPLFGSIQASIE